MKLPISRSCTLATAAVTALALLTASPVLAQAQPDAPGAPDGSTAGPSFSLRSNLPFFFVGGYHVEASVHLPGHWTFGLTL